MHRTLSKTACIIAAARAPPLSTDSFTQGTFVSLNKDQVRHIATLARLGLADDEMADVVDKLSRIVDFVDQLQAVPTDDVVPMAHPLNQTQRMRPDAVTESNERERFQSNSEAVQDGLYLVPKVLE
jgi:aspartyl-tRNA(Asn)/glutamyl-tRNA(Gln) amidotransferase subunit C